MATQILPVIAPADIRTGMNLRIHQKIREKNPKGEEQERVQIFEGLVINIHGAKIQRTMTVRKISNGVGVEKIFPLNLPTITKIEVKKEASVRRAKLYFLKRGYTKKLKEKSVK